MPRLLATPGEHRQRRHVRRHPVRFILRTSGFAIGLVHAEVRGRMSPLMIFGML